MTEDDYTFSPGNIGKNGYEITVYCSFARSCQNKMVTDGLTPQSMIKAVILSAIGIESINAKTLESIGDEIGVIQEINGTKKITFIICVSDWISRMIETKAILHNVDSSSYIGDVLLEYVTGIKVNYNEESTK